MIMRRTGKKKEQSLFVKYMLSPIRILKRARQLYMKGMQDCAGELGYGSGGVACYSTFPISQSQSFFDVKPLTLRARFGGGGDADDNNTQHQFRLRKDHVTDVNIIDAENQTRLVVPRQINKHPSVKHNGMITKMERIDEDKPCYFEEDQIRRRKITASTRMVLHPRRS